MTESEATVVLAAIAAAWPRDWAFVDPFTKDIYLGRIVALPRLAAATAAVNALIDTAKKLPTVAEIRDEYRRHHDAYAPLALPEPELTPEERAENARKMRALTDSITVKSR